MEATETRAQWYEKHGYRIVDGGQTGFCDDDDQADWEITDYRTGEVLASGHGEVGVHDAVWRTDWFHIDSIERGD